MDTIEKIEETPVMEISDEQSSLTDEYDLRSLPNINNCNEPVTQLLPEIDNIQCSILESEFMKLGVHKVNEIAFLTHNNIEQLTIRSPKPQTLYLAAKAFLEKDAKNKSVEEIEGEFNEKDNQENQPDFDIATYEGVITTEQILQLAKNNESFLPCLHDLIATEFLSEVFLSKISK